MQIVNGYICMNCCDVDKARLGQDPHQSADTLKKQIEHRLDKLATGKFGPAVNFGGSLQPSGDGTGDTDDATVTASQSAAGANSAASVDVIA
jgi:hypothetical protein